MTSPFFRPIYYLGCKANYTAAIKAAIDEVNPGGGQLIDLFAGTGAVSAALGADREVAAVDIQEYSRVLCSATLFPPKLSPSQIESVYALATKNDILVPLMRCLAPLIDYERACIDSARSGTLSPLIELLEAPSLAVGQEMQMAIPNSRLGDLMRQAISRIEAAGSLSLSDSTVSRYFGGVYFSFHQAAALDAFLAVGKKFEAQFQDMLTAVALSCASTLVNTVGKQFAQPLQPRNKSGSVKPGLIKTVMKDRSLNAEATYGSWLKKYAMLPKAIGKPQVLRGDYLQALKRLSSSASAVYADPPYTRDHYSRFYHVLETMCLRDNPAISHIKRNGYSGPSRGIYRKDRHQSPFCIRSEAPRAFEELFRATGESGLPLVLSYSPHETGDGTHPRAVSMEQLVELAKKHYGRVEVCKIDGSAHNKLNSCSLELKPREHAEILLKCFSSPPQKQSSVKAPARSN